MACQAGIHVIIFKLRTSDLRGFVHPSVGPSVHRSHTSENKKYAFFGIAGVIHRVCGGWFTAAHPSAMIAQRTNAAHRSKQSCAITTL